MRRSVIVILDGLRRDMVSAETTPRLAEFARKATWFDRHRAVFPSTTRVSSACIATGCFPRRHELAGNSLVLVEDGRLTLHDAGLPTFLQHKRRVTGRSLGMPTLAERLAAEGGAIVMSNVSPGAAYAHDPDGHGHVYHRAGSFGPGRSPVAEPDALAIGRDIAGDRQMTKRFVDEVLMQRRPALAVLWLGHPDTTQHAVPLGSPAHLAALAQADGHAGQVMDAVDRLRDEGDDILLMVGSDHGHQTIGGSVDVSAALVDARLKVAEDSDDVVVAANGTAALIYVAPGAEARTPEIADFLAAQPWAEQIIAGADLASVGQNGGHGLAVAVSLAASDEANAHGVPGTSLIAAPRGHKAVPIGCGQHGGLGRYEQAPTLMISGPGFDAGTVRQVDTSLVDLAPTVLTHLGLPHGGLDGRPQQMDLN